MSECEIAQYYICKDRIARKVHECCECAAPILAGELYLQVNACWEGRPSIERQHKLCQAACEFVRDNSLNDDECIYFGGLNEWYHDWIKGGYNNEEDISIRRKLWGMMLRIERRERKTRSLAVLT